MFCLLVLAVFCVAGSNGIIGGREAKIDEFPYQVSIENGNRHRAGGVLIRPDVVLTAAYALRYYRAEFLVVRAGSTKCSDYESVSDQGETSGVAQIYVHPRFEADSLDYDVAVLHLNRSFTMGLQSQPLLLIDFAHYVRDGTLANVTGWGANAYNNQLSKNLRTIDLPKFNLEKCSILYGTTIPDHKVCYGYDESGRGFTTGDEGGPLVIGKKLVGIASTQSAGMPKKPNVFVDVANKDVYDFVSELYYNPYS